MEFGWSPEESRFREDIREFLSSVLTDGGIAASTLGLGAVHPAGVPVAQQVTNSKYVCGRLAQKGFLTPSWPAEFGGQGMSPWFAAILAEELLRIGEPRGSQYMNVNWIGPSIMYAGSDEQKRYFLDRISRGDIMFCQGFSEPGAGTDLASLRTSAVRDGDEYIVNGEKIWTSHALTAEYCYLLVRTARQDDKHDGISILLVPMNTLGLAVRDIPAVGGLGKEVFANLVFSDMRVPVSARLGAEGQGWPIIRRSLSYERIGIARHLDASLRLERLVGWMRDRHLESDERRVRNIGRARSWCDAARVLFYRAVDARSLLDASSQEAVAVASAARIAGVQAERVVSEVAVLVMGEDALEAESVGAEYMSGIAAGIAAGAYEIQLDLLARQVFSGREGDPRR